jgi:hypothetical protein
MDWPELVLMVEGILVEKSRRSKRFEVEKAAV